jgi:hypothetical protein
VQHVRRINQRIQSSRSGLWLWLAVFSLSITSCDQYTNSERYELKVGETVEFYFCTLSLCKYCLVNAKNLNHIEFLDSRHIDYHKNGCEGCTSILAYVFEGISIGIDTLKVKQADDGQYCSDSISFSELIIIEVK